MSDMDEYIHISIHKSELAALDKAARKFVEDYRILEMYPNGRKKGKKVNKVIEIQRLITAMVKIRAEHKGYESNEECHYLAEIIELLQKMMLYEARDLHLEKLLVV